MQTATALVTIVIICVMFPPRVGGGGWTTDISDGVLDPYCNGVGLSFEVRLEDRRISDAKSLMQREKRGRKQTSDLSQEHREGLPGG